MARTSVSDIQADIHRLLADYVDGVGEKVEELSEEVAKEAAKKLKATSPRRKTNGGNYAKGWRAKKVGTAWVVHNKTHYQLTHLLEKGHAKANGTDRVDPVIHIKPVERASINKFVSEIERAIDNR